jgi:hypothetical protein
MGMSIKEIQAGVEYKVRGTTYSGVKFESLSRYSKDKRISARYTGEYRLDDKGMYFKTTHGTFVHITQVEELYSTYDARIEAEIAYMNKAFQAPVAEVVEAPVAEVVVEISETVAVVTPVTIEAIRAKWDAYGRDFARRHHEAIAAIRAANQ